MTFESRYAIHVRALIGMSAGLLVFVNCGSPTADRTSRGQPSSSQPAVPAASDVVAALDPPVDVQLPQASLDALAKVEARGKLAVAPNGRIPVLAGLPAGLEGFDAGVAVPDEPISGYVVFLGVPPGRKIPALAGYLGDPYIQLAVNSIDPPSRGNEQAFFSKFRKVKIGTHVGYVGSDVSPSCPKPPDESGYDTTVLTWYLADVRVSLSINPVPECEPGAMSLETAVEIASMVGACRGYPSGKPECVPLP